MPFFLCFCGEGEVRMKYWFSFRYGGLEFEKLFSFSPVTFYFL